MQKLFLLSLILINSQAIAMQLGTINARVSSTAARLAGAKRTTRSIAVSTAENIVTSLNPHLKYMHKHDAYLAQQLKGVAPLDAAEVAARAVLLSNAIKSVGFLTWKEFEGAERAHVRHTELAEKSAMLDRTELLPVMHACENALAIDEAPLLKMPLPNKILNVSCFAVYPFRFGAGLKYYNDLYNNTKQDLAHTDAKIAKLSHILASSTTRTLTLNDLDRKPTVGETVPFKRPVDRIDLVVRLAELKLDRQNTIEYLNTNFAARSRDLR